MKDLFRKNFPTVLVFILVIGIIHWNDKRKELEIERNKETSFALITSVGRKNQISYKFRYNGKWITGRNSGKSSVKEGEYYKVDFARIDPENSNLIVRNKSINPMTLINQGIEVTGTVTDIGYPSGTYLDLNISYSYKSEEFKFRTRKHKDSLPCGSPADCQNATILLKISSYFPELNNLYFESYDRSKLRQKIESKFN